MFEFSVAESGGDVCVSLSLSAAGLLDAVVRGCESVVAGET